MRSALGQSAFLFIFPLGIDSKRMYNTTLEKYALLQLALNERMRRWTKIRAKWEQNRTEEKT